MLNPIPIGGTWCEIRITHGNDTYHCPMMQKYQTVPKRTFCNFCKSVGHEDKDCKNLEIMKERTLNIYMVQVERMIVLSPCNFYMVTDLPNFGEDLYCHGGMMN